MSPSRRKSPSRKRERRQRISAEQLRAFLDEAVSRESARRGGRPPEKFNYGDQKRAVDVEAKRIGHTHLVPLAIMVWQGILDGSIPADASIRARVADSVASRFGLPRRTDVNLEVDLTKKYFDMDGYRDAQGLWHEVPADVLTEVKELPAASKAIEYPDEPSEESENGREHP